MGYGIYKLIRGNARFVCPAPNVSQTAVFMQTAVRGHIYRETAPSSIFGGILRMEPKCIALRWWPKEVDIGEDKRTTASYIYAPSFLCLPSSPTLVFYPPDAVPLSGILDISLTSTGRSRPDLGRSISSPVLEHTFEPFISTPVQTQYPQEST